MSLHLATMDTLRQAADPNVPITIACRLRSNAASITRTSLALIERLLDWQGPLPADSDDVPSLPVLRGMLADAAPPPPEPPRNPPQDPAGKNFDGATP